MIFCKYHEECIFYNDEMTMDKGLTALLKKKYCHGDYVRCARYMIHDSMGADNVPVNLYPNQSLEAKDIIGKGYIPR